MEMRGQPGEIGHVVECSARDCSYNQSQKCVAEAVRVNYHSDHADCDTYTHNQHIQGQQRQPGQLGMDDTF